MLLWELGIIVCYHPGIVYCKIWANIWVAFHVNVWGAKLKQETNIWFYATTWARECIREYFTSSVVCWGRDALCRLQLGLLVCKLICCCSFVKDLLVMKDFNLLRGFSFSWYLLFMKLFGCFSWLEMLELLESYLFFGSLEILLCYQVYVHYEALFVTLVCSRDLVTMRYSLRFCGVLSV